VKKERVLSGMRPTGKLHLGHLHGALENWRNLQDTYECYFFIADWHALTSEYSSPQIIKESIREMLIDWLSVGIDPKKSTLFIQSKILEHAELHLILSMITPLPWLERNPTYKEQLQEMVNRDLSTYGFLGYPVLQAADIIMYKANKVPVGVDQLPHLELTREIVRRFNFFYGEVFPVPDAILTKTPKLMGIDGRKMSKSYQNSIYLSDTPDEISEKISQMFTDPQRAKRSDPGNPEVCNLFPFQKIYNSPEEVEEIAKQCRVAGIGCVECKKILTELLIKALIPIQERRKYYSSHLDEVENILSRGIADAQRVAQATMEEVRRAVRID
jgi:tryptophanyl-tRNA synthetase